MSYRDRNWKSAIWRGFRKSCPSCGTGRMFAGYLTTEKACSTCGTEFHHHRADDAPPYFTIMVVGHIIVPLMLLVEKLWFPPLWVHAALWLPLTLLGTLWFLPRLKGATVGLQWAMGMHGFSSETPQADLH